MKPPPVTLQAAVVTPVHCPPEQVSGKVQALASSQGRVLFMCAQPLAGLQLSVVQTLWSSQLGGGPPTQAPSEQVSLVVQASPSLQAVPFVFGGFEQTPVLGLQVPTSWHWSEAVQTTGLEPVHIPLWQVSVCVQALPSLHAEPSAFGGLEQVPVEGLQVPAV